MIIKNRIVFSAAHCLLLSIILMTLVLQLLGWEDTLRYDRDLINRGDYWLLFSGHFVHLNWAHWALNMAGLVLVAFFFSAGGSMRQWFAVLLLSVVFVGLGLYWFNASLQWYVGFSGVLHGLFLFGAIREIKLFPVSGYALLIFLVGKIIWEGLYGSLPGSEAWVGASVITDAHLYGAIAGVVSAGLMALVSLYPDQD